MPIKIVKKGTVGIESNKTLTEMVCKAWTGKNPRDLPGYLNGLNVKMPGGSQLIARELAFLRELAKVKHA